MISDLPRKWAEASSKERFVWVFLAFVGVPGLAFYAWYLPQMIDPLRKASECKTNIQSLLLALRQYHSKYDEFPPAFIRGPDGTPWHSWRVLILPQLGRSDLYDKYDFEEPSSGPHNAKLSLEMPEVFRCPNIEVPFTGVTNYLAVVGPMTVWPGDEGLSLKEIDRTKKSIQIVESADSDVIWLEPRDLSSTRAEEWPSRKHRPSISAEIGPPHLGFVGGRVDGLSLRTSRSRFIDMLTARKSVLVEDDPQAVPAAK